MNLKIIFRQVFMPDGKGYRDYLSQDFTSLKECYASQKRQEKRGIFVITIPGLKNIMEAL
jgi:hypothetical protein